MSTESSSGGDNSAATPRPKTHNPFKTETSASPANSSSSELVDEILPHFPYSPTIVPRETLEKLPFKTSNRILDDLRLTPAYLALKPKGSLLHSRTYDYRNIVPSALAKLNSTGLVLNNCVLHIPSVSHVKFHSDSVVVTTVRGLIVTNVKEHLHHFRIQVLNAQGNGPVVGSVAKHEYHLISKEMVSVDDLRCLDEQAIQSDKLLDDAFFKSANSPTNQLMRVTVYMGEFSAEDLAQLTDTDIIKQRYQAAIEKNPSALSNKSYPTPLHCFTTLIKVLKGPILLPLGQKVHTINRSSTNLDAQINSEILFRDLGFKVGDDNDTLVPPDLLLNRSLKEAYIRKAMELVYLGKQLKLGNKINEFDTQYSFLDNFSQVYSAIAEGDKASSMSMARNDKSNHWHFYVALSAYSFYSEELIIKCFENMVLSDSENKLHYVDYYRSIMSNRPYQSQKLQTYYNNQYLKGFMFGLLDYHNALKAIGVHGAGDDAFVDEETVIEMYKIACRSDYKNYTYFNKQLRIICEIQNSSVIKKFLREEMVSPRAAIQELRIEEATEDEVVITAYEIRLDEVMQSVNFNTSSPEVVFLQKCLVSIATVRRSFLLMAYIDNTMPELMDSGKSFSFSEALDLLGVTATSSDMELITIFEALAKQVDVEDPSQFRDLRVAFKTLAEDKKSKILSSYLRSGRVDPSLLPAQNWPTGLDNIGNTCYLNSLLQYYFCIKPLRNMILEFDENDTDFSNTPARKIGGRSVEVSELDRSFQFVYRLQQLFAEMIHTRRRCVQPSKELAYLSFLPLSQPVSFKTTSASKLIDDAMEISDDADLEIIDGREGSPETPDIIEVPDTSDVDSMEGVQDVSEQSPFEALEDKKIKSIEADQIDSAIEIGRQQDVTECIENVTFQLETALQPDSIDDDGEQYDLIKKLFCGKTKQTITPFDSTKPSRSTMERFFSLIINVSDHPKDIYDALDNYFSENVVDLEEGTVKMSLTVLELPEILQFHVQRVLFDRERLMAYKSIEPIPFGEDIYLDRYLDTEDPDILKKRLEVYEWKQEIKNLQVQRDDIRQQDPVTKLSILDSLQATIKYLVDVVQPSPELSIKQETIDTLKMQVEMIQTKLRGIDNKIGSLQHQISEQFQDYKNVGYTLFAIFIHRGEASHGHYWIYIRDMERNIYRKYNDDTVTEVPISEVLNFAEGNTATPYYMVYVKDNLKREYIEPLKRVIEEEESHE